METPFPLMEGEEKIPLEKAEYVAEYVRYELRVRGLLDWEFYWDRARRRLGACWYVKRCISLSWHLLGEKGCSGRELRDTILHELAHALAFTHEGARGHGSSWKEWCGILGATPTRCSPARFEPSEQCCYVMRRKDTGEIVKRYLRKPRFKHSLKNLRLTSDPTSLGQLEIVPFYGE